jgi:LacI family transcriptional regulator
MTNIKDIALHCGVAISTVSRVLNDHPDVSEETREKVLRAVKELHYIPNTSARNLVRTIRTRLPCSSKVSTTPSSRN